MKKKLLTLLIVVALALGIVGIIKLKTPTQEVQEGNKQVTIIVINAEDNNKELYNKQLKTDAEYLYGLLKEHATELTLVAVESTQYVSINGLCGIETLDWNKGPWWMIESENSACGALLGYVPSVDQCTIQDGEVYIFTFTDFQ